MGCSQSKLDDEEAVQLCKDRKKFIKQALEQRTRFATGHIAYIESLRRVSAALRDYVEGDEPREFALDSVPFNPVKKTGPGFIPISAKSFTPDAIEFGVGPNSTLKVNYLRPGGNPAVSVEERPPSPEILRVENSYPYPYPYPYPPVQNYGVDGFFNMQSSPGHHPSIFAYSPNNNRTNIPPPSPPNAQWDFYWNPFSSLDYYGYPTRNGVDRTVMDDEYRGLRQVREEEGIPELEEDETEQEDYFGRRNLAEERTRTDPNMNVNLGRRNLAEERTRTDMHMNMNLGRRNLAEERTRTDMHMNMNLGRRNLAEERTRTDMHMNMNLGRRNLAEERTRTDMHMNMNMNMNLGRRNLAEERTRADMNMNMNPSREEVIVEDVDDDDDDEDDDDEEDDEEDEEEGTDIENETETKQVGRDPQASKSASFEVSKSQAAGHIESSHREMAIGKKDAKEETPGFTVFVNRRPTSMAEVINDLEAQFIIVCDAANDVSALLEAKKAQYSLASNELPASKLLNPVALFRSTSSRSSSSRFLMNGSSTREEGSRGTKDLPEERCMISGSHQSTLDRLNAWEKKLYEEVKSGERVRIAYEKKLKQLRTIDEKGEDPSHADKTRAAIRDLDTQITVSIHSVEAISRRIETLRDEELHPQLLELVKGLERMWKVMAECHQTQKRTLDEAKILLAGTPSKLHSRRDSSISMADPNRLARSASNLELELRNWQNTFGSWITSQRSYINALTGWLLRCVRSDPDVSKLPSSPHRSSGTHPLFGLCVQWSRRLDAIQEKAVLEGLDFFATGMGSLYAHQVREDSWRNNSSYGSKPTDGNVEMVEFGQVEEVMAPEKLAEVAIKVLCAGMSVAMSSLAEFAFDSAEGYSEVVKQWENVKTQNTSTESKT